mmetsp:Transcript_75425/g.219073  ORF Transcript_75425/g.219073 Transcript_75425/m.219073 type:complete len:200 (+) Transcript_75425:845-1444(+)
MPEMKARPSFKTILSGVNTLCNKPATPRWTTPRRMSISSGRLARSLIGIAPSVGRKRAGGCILFGVSGHGAWCRARSCRKVMSKGSMRTMVCSGSHDTSKYFTTCPPFGPLCRPNSSDKMDSRHASGPYDISLSITCFLGRVATSARKVLPSGCATSRTLPFFKRTAQRAGRVMCVFSPARSVATMRVNCGGSPSSGGA